MENKGSKDNKASENENSIRYEDKIRGLEEDISKLKSKERSRGRRDKVRLYSGLAGAVGALAGTKFLLEDSLRGLGESVGGAVDAVKTAKVILDIGNKRDEQLINQYLGKMPESVRDSYEDANSQAYFKKMTEAGQTALETISRGVKNFPGNESKPVKAIRDTRNWIVEKTKSVFQGEKGKEETQIRNTEYYSENYDKLAAIKKEAYKTRSDIKDEMARVARTAEINRQKGKVEAAKDGEKKFENLAKTYSEISNKFIDGINNLEVKSIDTDATVQSVVGDASNYGIAVDSFDNYGTGAFLTGAIVAGVLGYTVGKKLGGIGYSVVKPVVTGVKGTYKAGKGVAKMLGKGTSFVRRKASGLVKNLRNRKK